MIRVEQHPAAPDLKLSEQSLFACGQWVGQEIEDALSAQTAQQAEWRESMRLYVGRTEHAVRNIPITNAPNIEVTIGAIAADAIYAQALDLIFQVSPTVTVRAVGNDLEATKDAKALQRFVSWGTANEWRLREAADAFLLDDIQLGTGVLYIPWVETVKKTKSAVVTQRGPVILPVAVEDFLVPGGSRGDLQRDRWCGLRSFLTKEELETRAVARGWDIDGVSPCGEVSFVRTMREQFGRTAGQISRKGTLYEIWDLHALYDIDADGQAEDLLLTWDRTSRKILKAGFAGYDHKPFEAARYQIRPHLFYGLSVMEMMREYQRGTTEFACQWLANAMLANSRIWRGSPGKVPESLEIWPSKVIMANKDDLEMFEMMDVYPSGQMAIALMVSLAERRVGVQGSAMNRPSQVMGSRTPGITALSMLQQMNKRFAPAFDGMRLAMAGAVRQCLYRYQEKLLEGDGLVEGHIRAVLGDEDGARVVRLLKTPNFDEAMAVELTASSASVNRESDRQNAVLLFNMLVQYYERMLQLVSIAAQPTTPETVRSVAKQIAEKAAELIDRAVRTFDQVRDPATLIVEIGDELDGAVGPLSPAGVGGLAELLGGAVNAIGGGGGGAGGGEGLGGLPASEGSEGSP